MRIRYHTHSPVQDVFRRPSGARGHLHDRRSTRRIRSDRSLKWSKGRLGPGVCGWASRAAPSVGVDPRLAVRYRWSVPQTGHAHRQGPQRFRPPRRQLRRLALLARGIHREGKYASLHHLLHLVVCLLSTRPTSWDYGCDEVRAPQEPAWSPGDSRSLFHCDPFAVPVIDIGSGVLASTDLRGLEHGHARISRTPDAREKDSAPVDGARIRPERL